MKNNDGSGIGGEFGVVFILFSMGCFRHRYFWKMERTNRR